MHLHENCIVPYRKVGASVEFCLVTPTTESRWEFPKTAVNGDHGSATRLTQIAQGAGLTGTVEAGQPLGQFVARRGDQMRTVTAYLMQVESVAEAWPEQSNYRRLWCLPEEVRVRIRRKPLRQLVDVALRLIGPKSR